MPYYNRKLKDRARDLRNNPTNCESVLWNELKSRKLNGFQFYRQRPIGNYMVDFYCHKTLLVIEIDGEIHENQGQEEYDKEKDAYLTGFGLKVLRIKNAEINKNLSDVLKKIIENLKTS